MAVTITSQFTPLHYQTHTYTLQYFCIVGADHMMGEMEKYKCFCICCCQPLEKKFRLMKTGRQTVLGEALVAATQLSITEEESLCRACKIRGDTTITDDGCPCSGKEAPYK